MGEGRPHKITPSLQTLTPLPSLPGSCSTLGKAIANIQCKQIGLIVIELSWTDADRDSTYFLLVAQSLMFPLHFHCCTSAGISGREKQGEQKLRDVRWREQRGKHSRKPLYYVEGSVWYYSVVVACLQSKHRWDGEGRKKRGKVRRKGEMRGRKTVGEVRQSMKR